MTQNKYSEFIIKSIEDVILFLKEMLKTSVKFIYRGQSLYRWNLETSVGRLFYQRAEYSNQEIKNYELSMLKKFKSIAHHFIQNDYPDSNDLIEWLSLLQHNGCKTRLLDFTRSIFIALYFIVFTKQYKNTYSAIYMVHEQNIAYHLLNKLIQTGLDKKLHEIIKKRRQPAELTEIDWNYEYFWELANSTIQGSLKNETFPGIIPIEPKRKNRRILMQQGCFLLPIDFRKTFNENLSLHFDSKLEIKENPYVDKYFSNDFITHSKEEIEYLNSLKNISEINVEEICKHDLIKIIIPSKLKYDIEFLLKEMNINQITLFPDKEGLIDYMNETFDRRF